ncbi:MAG: hypothetical protein HRT97_05755 [Moritella sp.]|uniref:hypothetical protein n=1 Tax=Moritella sp. TaxID=78556 RepID=UPI0025DAE8F2|nr:hypothetical protein [Moritella sp.]NQZ91835.1 hypothetical protein [Moritella sp.]
MNHSLKLVAFSYLTFTVPTLYADQIIQDDLIVNGNGSGSSSVCIGSACEIDHEFDFDTLLLKGTSPRIDFIDTSSSASFASNDWQIGIDSSVDTYQTFAIKDVNADKNVLVLQSQESGGVAIGADSTLVEGAISVGSPGAERVITYVAEGSDANDAVNMGQFTQFTVQISTTVTAQTDNFNLELVSLSGKMDALSDRIDSLVTRIELLSDVQ